MKIEIRNPLPWVLCATALTIGGASLLQYTALGPWMFQILQVLYEAMSAVSQTWQASVTCVCILGYSWMASWVLPVDQPGVSKKMAWLLSMNFLALVVFMCFATKPDERATSVMVILSFGVLSGLIYGQYDKHK